MTHRNFSYFELAIRKHFTSSTVFVVAITLWLVVASHRASATDASAKSRLHSCTFSDAEFDPATDVHAFEEYEDAIAQLLKERKFAELDCLADQAWVEKSRFSGGTWKLAEIYTALEEPRPGHPTEPDWRQHLRLLEQWKNLRPRSITARVALAESYVSYGWDARGTGYSDSVSDSGWKLMAQRVQNAKGILDQASRLGAKCPEWYIAMLDVAQGQNWPLDQITAVFEQGVKVEPEFQHLYRVYAVHLLPKWSGQEGDAARFAEEAANKIGGDDGDILYYQIASKAVCGCHDRDSTYFSWPRVLKGYAALEKKYGLSLLELNHFAALATDFNDWIAAKAAFDRIGDNWAKEVWGDEQSFKSSQAMAPQYAAVQSAFFDAKKGAEANMQAPEWEAYRKGFEDKLAALEQSCKDAAKSDDEAANDSTPFDLVIRIGKEGSIEQLRGLNPPPSAQCLTKALYEAYSKREGLFPAPPKAPYWVVAHVDPSRVNTATK